MTAATARGPASGPRPASSTPATRRTGFDDDRARLGSVEFGGATLHSTSASSVLRGEDRGEGPRLARKSIEAGFDEPLSPGRPLTPALSPEGRGSRSTASSRS